MIFAPFASHSELDDLLRAFEAQSLSPEGWTHREHLAIAVLYARRHPVDGLERMRQGIRHLNRAQGVVDSPTRGYHETLTVAWMRVVSMLVDMHPKDDERTLVNEALVRFADKRMLLRFYSRDRLMSPEARAGWVEPDLAPFRIDELEISDKA